MSPVGLCEAAAWHSEGGCSMGFGDGMVEPWWNRKEAVESIETWSSRSPWGMARDIVYSHWRLTLKHLGPCRSDPWTSASAPNLSISPPPSPDFSWPRKLRCVIERQTEESPKVVSGVSFAQSWASEPRLRRSMWSCWKHCVRRLWAGQSVLQSCSLP